MLSVELGLSRFSGNRYLLMAFVLLSSVGEA
jgi:hypothetical protein